jgi:hypothetical protein
VRKSTSIAIAALACLLAATLVVPATGAVRSRVTIGAGFDTRERGEPFFRGRVHTTSACRGNRLIVVYRAGNRGKRFRFGAARTTSRGFWRVPMSKPMRPAGYFAVVRPRGACLGDRSQEMAVGQGGPGGLGPGGTGK